MSSATRREPARQHTCDALLIGSFRSYLLVPHESEGCMAPWSLLLAIYYELRVIICVSGSAHDPPVCSLRIAFRTSSSTAAE